MQGLAFYELLFSLEHIANAMIHSASWGLKKSKALFYVSGQFATCNKLQEKPDSECTMLK